MGENYIESAKKYHWWDLRHLKFNTCLTLGVISNVFFFLFILICLYYYDMYQQFGEVVMGFEIAGYTTEALGFLFMAMSIFGIIFRVQNLKMTKILISVYLLLEITIMTVEFQFFYVPWYNSYSTIFIIAHAVFSAAVCYAYLLFDPYTRAFKRIVVISSIICLAGMFWVIYGFRVYMSLLTNCFAYLILYIDMKIRLMNENLEVQCYGDPAKVIDTKSIFFE